jgi:hypothetical protein
MEAEKRDVRLAHSSLSLLTGESSASTWSSISALSDSTLSRIQAPVGSVEAMLPEVMAVLEVLKTLSPLRWERVG